MRDIEPTRKAMIRQFLARHKCSPSVRGYNILIGVIDIAIDNPDESCGGLFDLYMFGKDPSRMNMKPPKGGWGHAAYRSARYCFINSSASGDYKGVYEFIKQGAVEIDGAESELGYSADEKI